MTDINSKSNIFANLDTIGNFAVDLQNELQQREITVRHENVTVTILGNQQVKEILVDGVANENIRQAVSKAIIKSQKMAAEVMAELPKNNTNT